MILDICTFKDNITSTNRYEQSIRDILTLDKIQITILNKYIYINIRKQDFWETQVIKLETMFFVL